MVGFGRLGTELMGFDSLVVGFENLVKWWQELGSLEILAEYW